MVWVVEKKVFSYILDMGFERVEIPVRVKFEFEVKEATLVPDTLSKEILYNRKAVEARYPRVRLDSLHLAVEEMVDREIREYLKRWGWLQAGQEQEKHGE